MSEQSIRPISKETSKIASWQETERIVGLGELTINNPFPHSKEQHPQLPLFNEKQAINIEFFWRTLLDEHGALSRNQLQAIGDFLRNSDTQDGIREVHDQLMAIAGPEKSISGGGTWFTNLMLYPLVKNLIFQPPDAFKDAFRIWRADWLRGIDPKKFHMVFSVWFRFLSKAPRETQEEFIPIIGEQSIQESEADLLTGIFEKVYGESNDMEKLREADERGRRLVGQIDKGELQLTAEDLYHTTDLATLPSVVKNGLLATECTSLTQDGYRESSYAASLHNFKKAPVTFSQLGEQLRSGEDTIRVLQRKVHLAFLKPQQAVNPEFILYTPDSFWSNRATRKNTVAGRYIGGYDSSASEFENKTIAYILIGMPSTATSFIILDEKLANDYVAIAKDFPFYIPAYSYKGKLLYSSEDYDRSENEK